MTLTREAIEDMRRTAERDGQTGESLGTLPVTFPEFLELCDLALRALPLPEGEVKEAVEQLRMMAQAGYFKCAGYADLIERQAASLATVERERDEARHLAEARRQLIGSALYGQQAAEASLAQANAELNRRKGDAVTRLHNICEAVEDPGPFSRAEWDRLEAENAKLTASLASARREALEEAAQRMRDYYGVHTESGDAAARIILASPRQEDTQT